MRHKSFAFSTLACATVLLSACGGGTVTVQVMNEAEDEVQPVEDQVVEFLPYDRDSIFDALAAAAEEPEPEVPQSLQAAFDSVADLQGQWRDAETEWGEVRDSLKQLSDRLRGMDQRSREYRQLYDRFNSLDARERRLNRQKQQAFTRFDSLQKASLVRADSIRAIREAWEDVAFQEYGTIVDSILQAEGKEVYEDTTGADGTVSRHLSGGTWYVYSRLAIPFGELYWNVPLNPSSTDTLRLTSENAERRIRL